MLLRQFACAKIFVTSLAIASQGQTYESKEALNINTRHNGHWKSGDCINQKPSTPTLDTNYSQNKPLLCIRVCKESGYAIAGLNNWKCMCGSEPEGSHVQKNNGKCNTPCPGQPDSACGGGNWWNIFFTDEEIEGNLYT